MSFVFLLIVWLTSLRSGGPQQGPVALAVHPGPGAPVSAFGSRAACMRRPVGHPGRTQVIAEDLQVATSEDDSPDSEKICGGHLRASLDLLAVPDNPGALTSPEDRVGRSRAPSRSPLLRC